MNHRFGLKIVSLILGVLAWAYVNMIISPEIRRTVHAPIIYRNKPELMRIVPEKPEVEIELKGSRRDFIMSGAVKYSASVDLYNVRPGKAILPIKTTAFSGLSVVSVNPGQIELTATPLARKRLKIDTVVKGEAADGFIAEKPRINPEYVIIECPSALVDKINSCKVEINLNQVKNSISESRPVVISSAIVRSNEKIKIIPDKVSVDVAVKEGYPTKLVAIASPTFINKPPEGVKLESFAIAPDKIMLSGPSRILNKINSLETKTIDLATVKRTSVLTLNFITPKNVKVVGSSSVLIKMKEVKITKKYSNLSFELKKNDQQYTEVSVASYTMLIEGYVHDLDSIRNDQLKIVLDVSKMLPGKYEVPLSVPAGLPEALMVKKIIPEEVNVTISSLASNAPVTKNDNQPRINKESEASTSIKLE